MSLAAGGALLDTRGPDNTPSVAADNVISTYNCFSYYRKLYMRKRAYFDILES